MYFFRKILNRTKRKIDIIFDRHPSSAPYLSGDTFRSIANHYYTAKHIPKAAEVCKNDVIFVESPFLDTFFTKVHPHITQPYILITHNGDRNITDSYFPYLSDTVIHWFAQNCLITHPKITPLPIGLENKWLHLHGIPRYFDILRNQSLQKTTTILYKFNVKTNLIGRTQALTTLERHPLAQTYNDWRESFTYLRTLKHSKFVASPPGNGEDCIRTWESMYLGTVPILKRSALSEYYFSLGLPLVLITDWTELLQYNEEKLAEIYATMATKWDAPALWANYWITQINAKKI